MSTVHAFSPCLIKRKLLLLRDKIRLFSSVLVSFELLRVHRKKIEPTMGQIYSHDNRSFVPQKHLIFSYLKRDLRICQML
jgi:hypothetical protein